MGCNQSTLYRWFWLYQQRGLEGLLEHPLPLGRPSELTPAIRQELEQKLSDPNGWRSYGELKEWLQREFGVSSSYSSVYRWVREKLQSQPKCRNGELRKPGSGSSGSSKKTLQAAERHAPALRRLPAAALLLHGQSRWGLKTELGRGITLQGVKPVAPVRWPRAHCWLYGAVEVPSGQLVFYLFSHLDAVCFQRFLDHLAQQCSAVTD